MARKRKHRTGRSTLSLLPARIRLATNGVIPDEPPPAGVPVQGVPLGIFKELSRKGRSAPGVEVLIDPIFEADKWNEIRLFINGVQSGVPQNDLDRTIIFNVFQTEFRDNITNVIKYVIRNVAGNENESTELWALYSANRPGGNIPGTGPHPGLIISLPEELGDPPLIDKESANAGVYATQTYSHMKAHDKITLEMGNERFDFKVKPGEVGQSVKTLIERHMFDLVGSQKNCSFRYTVTDQLLNTTDARRWSDYIYANIGLESVALTKPILREDRSDTGDDPKTVDLTKLAGGPLLVIIVPKEAIYQKDDCVRVIFRSSHMDREFEYFGNITVDDFGLLQPCIVEVPNSNIVLDSDLTVTFELHRPQGTVIGYSRSATAKVIGVAVPDLEAPSIKEADGNSLDPLKAKDALTAVIPAYDNMVGTYLEVSWIGTAGGGSHTTTPVLVTAQGDQEVALPNTVVALNLNKPVNVIYKVIRNGSPKDSKPLVLAVQPIADGDPAMGRPLIVEAANGGDGSEFDVSQLTKDATIRVNIWPLIALAQYVWLRVFGTKSNGDEYTQTFWQPPNGKTNATWISQGYWTQLIPLAILKTLKDGSVFIVEVKVGLGGSQVEAEAVTFQGRRYILRILPALKIDTTTMILDGPQLYPAPAPLATFYEKTAYIHPKAHQTRQAQGGSRPYQYSSSNHTVASVDPSTGHVTSTGNGATRITVRDTKDGEVSYDVICENVYEVIDSSPLEYFYRDVAGWLLVNNARFFPVAPSLTSSDPLAVAFAFSFQSDNPNWNMWAFSSLTEDESVRPTGTTAEWDIPTPRAGVTYAGRTPPPARNLSIIGIRDLDGK